MRRGSAGPPKFRATPSAHATLHDPGRSLETSPYRFPPCWVPTMRRRPHLHVFLSFRGWIALGGATPACGLCLSLCTLPGGRSAFGPSVRGLWPVLAPGNTRVGVVDRFARNPRARLLGIQTHPDSNHQWWITLMKTAFTTQRTSPSHRDTRSWHHRSSLRPHPATPSGSGKAARGRAGPECPPSDPKDLSGRANRGGSAPGRDTFAADLANCQGLRNCF